MTSILSSRQIIVPDIASLNPNPADFKINRFINAISLEVNTENFSFVKKYKYIIGVQILHDTDKSSGLWIANLTKEITTIEYNSSG
jgi:hypothetical protein